MCVYVIDKLTHTQKYVCVCMSLSVSFIKVGFCMHVCVCMCVCAHECMRRLKTG